MLKAIITTTTAALFLAGCSSTSPADNWRQYVTPKPDGIYSAEVRGTSAEESKQTALLIARSACSASTGQLSVTNESTKYDGPTGSAKAFSSALEIGAALYGHNTGNYYGWSEDAHYKTSLDFRCDTQAL